MEKIYQTIYKLRRLELAHIRKGIRAKDPDKRNYHLVMVRDCRAKVDYLIKHA